MEEKYEFIRGEHPNETVAYLLAEDIAKVLRERGRTVEVKTVNEKRTNIWHARQLLAGKKLKSHLSVRPGYIRALNNPLSVSFNFHNFLWNGSPPPEDLKFKFRTSESEKIDGNPFFEIKHANYFLIELLPEYF